MLGTPAPSPLVIRWCTGDHSLSRRKHARRPWYVLGHWARPDILCDRPRPDLAGCEAHLVRVDLIPFVWVLRLCKVDGLMFEPAFTKFVPAQQGEGTRQCEGSGTVGAGGFGGGRERGLAHLWMSKAKQRSTGQKVHTLQGGLPPQVISGRDGHHDFACAPFWLQVAACAWHALQHSAASLR